MFWCSTHFLAIKTSAFSVILHSSFWLLLSIRLFCRAFLAAFVAGCFRLWETNNANKTRSFCHIHGDLLGVHEKTPQIFECTKMHLRHTATLIMRGWRNLLHDDKLSMLICQPKAFSHPLVHMFSLPNLFVPPAAFCAVSQLHCSH